MPQLLSRDPNVLLFWGKYLPFPAHLHKGNQWWAARKRAGSPRTGLMQVGLQKG